MKAKVYVTHHFASQEISASLAKGFAAQIVPCGALLPGLAITYGILRGTGEIIKAAEAGYRQYLYCDHAFFGPLRRDRAGRQNCFYRLIRNGRHLADVGRTRPGDRYRALRLETRPWRTSGKHVVVVPMSSFVAAFNGVNATKWLNDTIATLTKHTNRSIFVKPKDDQVSFEKVLEDAWAVVASDSMAAVDAARLGIPVFVGADSAASPVGNFDLSAIERPRTPERGQWLADLAYQQFTLNEIEDGTAKRILYD